jgi:hypothetical protein
MAQTLALAVFELRQRRRRSWVPLVTPDERPKLRRQRLILEADGRIRLTTEAERAEHERHRAEAGRDSERRRGTAVDSYSIQSGRSGAER